MHFINATVFNGKVGDMYCANNGRVGDDILETVRELVRNNDTEALRNILTDLSNFERDELISAGTLDEGFTSGRCKHSMSALKKPCPILFEAVTLGGKLACVSILLENGFTFETRDTNGWNILHYLIAVSHFDPSYEATAVDIWSNVQKMFDAKQLENLLKQEDLEELRPVELALHLECLLIFNEIMNSSIYLTERKQFSLWERLTYDVTDYENCGCRDNRRSKSLLLLAAHVDKTILTNKQHVSILRHGMLQKWTHSKMIINILPICIWFLLRFFAFLAFYQIISSDLPQYLRILNVQEDLMSYLHSLNFTNLTTRKALNDSIDAVFEDNQTYTNHQRAELLKIINELYSLCNPYDWYNVFNVKLIYDFCINYFILYSIVSILYDIVEQCLSLRRKWYQWRYAFGRKEKLDNLFHLLQDLPIPVLISCYNLVHILLSCTAQLGFRVWDYNDVLSVGMEHTLFSADDANNWTFCKQYPKDVENYGSVSYCVFVCINSLSPCLSCPSIQ